jgi:hypothetical protein
MACFYPLQAYQTDQGDITFAERGQIRRELKLPCGQCIGCRLERSRQWATRCIHEAQMHDHNCFITLTYTDEHNPHDLIYRHFQKFMKRLRRLHKVRFYMCGEYGENTGRPHFHACIFGFDFKDKKLFRSLPSGSNLYTSETLEKLWPFGYSTIGDVTFESAAYVARYVMKKVTGSNADDRYWSVNPYTGEAIKITPEFNNMSRKPGIGKPWLDKYLSDVYPAGKCIINATPTKPPRFYKNIYENINPLRLEEINYEAMLKVNPLDTTPERLLTRELVTKARLQHKIRGFV